MSSRLTPKPRVALLRSAVASTAAVLALSTAACADPIAPMPPPMPGADAAPVLPPDGGSTFDAYAPPPMPPPEDAGEPPRDGPMSPVDAALAPMVDVGEVPVDSGVIAPMPPPMPPPMPDPGDPDSGVIAPMPPPPPPMPAPKP